MRIESKLVLGFLVMTLLVEFVGFLGFSGSQKANYEFDKVVHQTAPAIFALGKIESSVVKMQREAIISGLLFSESSLAKEEDKLKEAKTDFEFWQGEFTKLAEDEREKEFVRELGKYKDAVYNATIALMKAKKEGKPPAEIFYLQESLKNAEGDFEESVNATIDSERNKLEMKDKELNVTVGHQTRMMLVVFIAAVIMAIIVALIMGSFISRPIAELTGIIENISVGKLDVEISPRLKKSRDEIGNLARAFDRTLVSLKLAMKKIEGKSPDKEKGKEA